MPYYRKWAVYSPHHKHNGRCFNSSSLSQIDVSFTVKKFHATKPLGQMFQINCSYKCLPLYLTIIYMLIQQKKNAKSLRKKHIKFACLCSIKYCASMAFYLEIQFTIV